MADRFSAKDFILVFLYSPGVNDVPNEPVAGRTRITKAIFLFEKEIWTVWKFDHLFPDLQAFAPWLYGPYSSEVFSDLDFFIRLGFITSSEASVDTLASVEAAEELEMYQEDFSVSEYEALGEYVEESFALSALGMRYVEEKALFGGLSDTQKGILKEFKSKINTLSLKDLLRYVYGRYPQWTSKSTIADKL